MTRQVDVKALVSHVIRGDGANKCRICMGDTSEGQVHLSDTVVMEGDKPVTLSELLEIVTGIQVPIDGDLPAGLCTECSTGAINAAEFRTMCRQTSNKWDLTLQLLYDLPSQSSKDDQIMFAIIESDQMIVINDKEQLKPDSASERLTTHITKQFIKKEEPTNVCQCPNCGKKFQYPLKLYHHLKGSTDLKRACHICSDIMSRDELVVHLFKKHNREPYDCKKCPALLLTNKQYIHHLTKAHSRGACTCVDCGQTFQSSNAFYAHVSVHRQKTCPSCDKIFRNQTCYVYHVKRCCNLDQHRQVAFRTKTKVTIDVKNENSSRNVKVGLRGSADEECVCDYCGKSFAKKKYIAAHIQIVHMKNTHRPCAYCGKLLATAHMTEHIKKHEIDYSYTCDHCGIVLKTKLGYVQHLRLHTGERPYACKVCGETFMASSRRSEHMRKVHKKPDIVLKHACKLCPARFRLPYRLKKHIQSAHIEETDDSSLEFECKECHEKFGSCRGLLHHSRKHQKVLEETELPRGLCSNCIHSALLAWKFKLLCRNSNQEWQKVATVLAKNSEDPSPGDTTFYISCEEGGKIFKDHVSKIYSLAKAAERLNRFSNANRKQTRVYQKEQSKIRIESKCHICGKAFNLPYYLNKHLINTSKRACTLCGKIVPKAKLQKHLENVHNKFVHYCQICHRLFDNKANYDEHREVHSTDSPQCVICKLGFKNDRSLRAHMYAHTLFNCSSCNRSFENRKCYVYHKEHCTESKHSIEAEGTYECHDCGRKYSKKPSLRVHIVQKHLNVLPFVCQICGKRSSTRNHMKSHELVHKTERKIYQCFCGAKLRTSVGFHMHQRIHSGEKPYECVECGDRFLSASRRMDHIKRRHRVGEMAHGCDECGARFIRPFELKKHYRAIQEEQLFPQLLCVTCTQVATTAYEFRQFVKNAKKLWNNCINSIENLLPLKTHNKSFYCLIKENLLLQSVNNFEGSTSELVHHLSNRFKKKPIFAERKARHPRTGPTCDCTDCGKNFLSPYYLNIHLRNSGQKEACWLCGTMVIRGLQMKEHLSKTHKTEMVLCPECPLLFKTELDRKKHLKKCHCSGKLTCTDCGRTFQRKASFEVHSQMHTVRTCRACGAQFTNRGCYREHRAKCEPDAKPDIRTVPRSRRSNIRDPATFTCDYCGKTYHSRPQLKNHILWIHMDIRPYQCQWCGKRFYTPARLAEHTVVHTRVRNFECDICGAKLVSKMAAVYHRRRHTGEKPYECEDCGERFISSSRRSEHAKRRHNRGSRFQCSHCHSSFVRSHELKKHVDKVHSSENNQIVLKVKKERDLLKTTP